jgi:hypothetical protein
MLNRISQCLAIIAVVALSAPVFARSNVVSQPLDLDQPATIGSTVLQPGQYKIMADLSSDQVRVKNDSNGKFVASVEGKTVTLNKKSVYGAVVMNGNRIHEIQFSGRTEAIEIPNS